MKQNWCDQSKLYLSIDIIMLLLLMPLAGIGFLIKYVLIPGLQRNEHMDDVRNSVLKNKK